MSTETTAAFVAVTPLWRRIVDRLVPPEPVPGSWYELHDQVPQGGDMLTTATRVRLSWAAIVRLALLGGRPEVETRTITRQQPVRVVSTRGKTYVG